MRWLVGLILALIVAPAPANAVTSNDVFTLTADHHMSAAPVNATESKVALGFSTGDIGVNVPNSNTAYFDAKLAHAATGVVPLVTHGFLSNDVPVVMAPAEAQGTLVCPVTVYVGVLDASDSLVGYWWSCIFNGVGALLPGNHEFTIDWTAFKLTPHDVPVGGSVYTSFWIEGSSPGAAPHAFLLVGGANGATLEMAGTTETPPAVAIAPQPAETQTATTTTTSGPTHSTSTSPSSSQSHTSPASTGSGSPSTAAPIGAGSSSTTGGAKASPPLTFALGGLLLMVAASCRRLAA